MIIIQTIVALACLWVSYYVMTRDKVDTNSYMTAHEYSNQRATTITAFVYLVMAFIIISI